MNDFSRVNQPINEILKKHYVVAAQNSKEFIEEIRSTAEKKIEQISKGENLRRV